ncbi:MAG TPA: type II toxin-antitoxin system VapC family toxin [Bryobacteraceae bacterium]|nr:type II toxin-antitoxin system VapC family toxin [Bryobacteraceae bacterium]
MTETGGYLIDTNVISELRRNKPHGSVVAWIKAMAASRYFVSAFSIAELQAGVERVRDHNPAKAIEIEAWIDRICQTWSMLPMDAAVCRQWARETKGKSDALFEDAWIAATARVHGLTVVTRNSKDFDAFRIATLNPFAYRGE